MDIHKLKKIARKILNSSIELKFFSDPGHGWLEVPVDLYRESGIAASQYSYYDKNKNMLYLEEDSDAPKFEDALKAKGKTFTTKTVYEEKDSKIRSLPRIKGKI